MVYMHSSLSELCLFVFFFFQLFLLKEAIGCFILIVCSSGQHLDLSKWVHREVKTLLMYLLAKYCAREFSFVSRPAPRANQNA